MTPPTNETDTALGDRLQEVLSLHFDPKWGTPYWLGRARSLGFDPRREVQSLHDLPRLGLMQPQVLTSRTLDDFIPKSLRRRQPGLIVAQTGGTLGRPAWTAYVAREFETAFVEPFVAAARHVGFPTGGTWLYAGPSGPHVIARAADAIARRTGSRLPFAVDFDPRWAKKLLPGSFAAERYLRHVVAQALAVIRLQPIDVLFTTPLVLGTLAAEMTRDERERVRGVHYGGMAIDPVQLRRFQTEAFPHAVHLSGYGNTLFGCCLELSTTPGRTLRYYPYGNRLVLGVVVGEDESECRPAPHYGESPRVGRLVFSRLDRTMLLVNMLERDRARVIEPPPDAPAGFRECGVESPSPAVQPNAGSPLGLY